MEDFDLIRQQDLVSSSETSLVKYTDEELYISREIEDLHLKFNLILDEFITYIESIENNSKGVTLKILLDLKYRKCNFNTEYIEKLMQFVANTPESIFLEVKHKQIIFRLLTLYAQTHEKKLIGIIFLNNTGDWILDNNTHSFLYEIASASETRFPDPEVMELVRDSKIGIQGISSPYESIFPSIISLDSSRKKVQILNVENTIFYRKLTDIKFNLTFEEEFARDLIVLMVCAGIPAIRNLALKKIILFLNIMGLVKMGLQLISVIIYNIDLEKESLDAENIKILISLKVKPQFENLVNSILYYFFQHYSEQIKYIVKLLININSDSNTYINRMVTITRLLFNSDIKLIMSVLIDLWYSCDEKNEIYISNCFRESEYSHLIQDFCHFLFESYDQNLALPVYLLRTSRTIMILVLESYFISLDRPKYPGMLKNISNYKNIDEKLSQILYNVRILYLAFMDNVITQKKQDIHINRAFCEGLMTLLYLKPLSYYLPKSVFKSINTKFMINNIIFFVLSDECVSFTIKMIDFLCGYSDIFYLNILNILDIFLQLFELLINNQEELKDNINYFVNILIQNDFITKIFNICSRPIEGSEARRVEFSRLINIQCLYLKFFILSPLAVGSEIFKSFIPIKYMLLKIGISRIDIKNYVIYEKAVFLDLKSTVDDTSNSKNHIIFDLKRSIFDFEIHGVLKKYSQNYKIFSLLNDCPFFLDYFENIWFYSLSISNSDPFEIYRYVSFISDFINFQRLSFIPLTPKIILISYLTLNYFRSFFQDDKSINQSVIEFLYKCKDNHIMVYLKSMLKFHVISTPTIILFFLLSSKSYTQNDYLIDSLHLDSYTFELDTNEFRDLIFNAVISSFKNEVSNLIMVNILKMMRIIRHTEGNIYISEWIIDKYKMFEILILKYDAFNLIYQNLKIGECFYEDPKYTLSMLILLSVIPDSSKDEKYLDIKNKILIQKELYFSIEFLESHPIFLRITKCSDIDVLQYFVNRAIDLKSYDFQIDFLLQCLKFSFHLLDSSKYFLRILSEILQKDSYKLIQNKMFEYGKIVKRAFEIHKNIFDETFRQYFYQIFLLEQKEEKRSEICIDKISNSLIQSTIFEENNKECFSSSFIKYENIPEYKIDNFESLKINETEEKDSDLYSRVCHLIKENPLEAVFLIGSCASEINHILSYKELIEFLIDISKIFDDTLINFSVDILKVIRCLVSHPQLYLKLRQVTISYEIIKKFLSLGEEFYFLLCKCLIYEISREEENPISKLNSDYYLWIHVLDNVNVEYIEKSFYKYSCCTIPLLDSNYSVRCLVLFLHLNLPQIFEYNLEIDPNDLDKFREIIYKFDRTVLDEFILKVVKNAFECLTLENPSITSSLRFLYFCKIVKLYPLLIFRHTSFILSCLCLSLKTSCFIKSHINRSRKECILVIYDIFHMITSNQLTDEDAIQASKINSLLDIVREKDINLGISVYNIDFLILELGKIGEKNYDIKIPEILPTEISSWLINHPINQISELKKQLFTLGNNLDNFYRKKKSKMTFIKSLLSLVIIVPQFWQNQIIEKILITDSSFDNDDILNLLTKHHDLFSIFEDYYNLFSYKF